MSTKAAHAHETHHEEPRSPESMQKVSPGRIVMYVLPDGGEARPMIVIRVWNGNGSVSGHVFHNGQDDVAHDPHGPFKNDVTFDANKKPGTWHWPTRV